MNYIELINWFWELDEVWQFTCCETRLYFYLVKTANRLGWANSWTHSDVKTAANVGVSPITMKGARNKLIQSGLIDIKGGGKGFGDKTRYQILSPNLQPKPQPKPQPTSTPKVQPITKQKQKPKLNKPDVCPPTGDVETAAIEKFSDKEFLENVIKVFNEKCLGLPPLKILTPKRKEAVLARYREYGKDKVFEMLEKAGKSKFLAGQSKSGFVASFDWIFRPTNFVKTLEGIYDERGHNGGGIDQGKQNLFDRIKQEAANNPGVS